MDTDILTTSWKGFVQWVPEATYSYVRTLPTYFRFFKNKTPTQLLITINR